MQDGSESAEERDVYQKQQLERFEQVQQHTTHQHTIPLPTLLAELAGESRSGLKYYLGACLCIVDISFGVGFRV